MVQPAIPTETLSTNPRVQVNAASIIDPRTTALFGAYLIGAFVVGLAFFALLIAAEVYLKADKRPVFLNVDDLVKLATTFGSLIGPPLGFVISYYFKEREGP